METTFFFLYVYLLFSFYAKTNDELWMYSSLFFFFFSRDSIISSASCEMNRMLQIVLIQTNTILLLWRGTEKQIETNQHTVKGNADKCITEWAVDPIEETLLPQFSLLYTHTHTSTHLIYL